MERDESLESGGFHGKSSWDRYEEKPVCVHYGQVTVYGRVNEIDEERGVVYLMPSMRQSMDGTEWVIDRGLPSMIPIHGAVVRPLRDGEMEQFLKNANAKLKAERDKAKQ